MREIIMSKGIICFFVFIIAIGFISTNSINSMNNNDNKNIVVINENI